MPQSTPAPTPPLMATTPESVVPRSRVERIARLLSALVVLGTLSGAGAVVLSMGETARAERTTPGAVLAAKFSTMEAARAPVTAERPGQAVPWIVPAPVERTKRQEQLKTPLASAVPPTSAHAEARPAPAAPAAPEPVVAPSASPVPVDCLPEGLRAVLRDVESRFGPATLVSTTTLHTHNHSQGSVRHRLHTGCRAVDFKIQGDVRAVTAYLRTRKEVAGLTAFGNTGVIHIDHTPTRTAAAR